MLLEYMAPPLLTAKINVFVNFVLKYSLTPPYVTVLLVNSVVELSSKDTEPTLEYIAPPRYLAVLLVNSVMEFSSKDIEPSVKYIAPP